MDPIRLIERPEFTSFTTGKPKVEYESFEARSGFNCNTIIAKHGELSEYTVFEFHGSLRRYPPGSTEFVFNGIEFVTCIRPQFCLKHDGQYQLLMLGSRGNDGDLIIVPDEVVGQLLEAINLFNIYYGLIQPILIV